MSGHARVVRSVLRDYFEEYGSAKQEAQTMAENQRLRDALADFANVQHWAVTRDNGQPVPIWIGSIREHPSAIARAALDGSE